MLRLFLLFISSTFIVLYGAEDNRPLRIGSIDRKQTVIQVSPLVLVSHPEQYDGKLIQTDLYALTEGADQENPYLFFIFKDDLDEYRTSNAFYFSLKKNLPNSSYWAKIINKKRVLVIGLYRRDSPDKLFFTGCGAITEIEYLQLIK